MSCKSVKYKTGVINDLLGQPTDPAASECCLILKFWNGRTDGQKDVRKYVCTDNQCEYSDHYRRGTEVGHVDQYNFGYLQYDCEANPFVTRITDALAQCQNEETICAFTSLGLVSVLKIAQILWPTLTFFTFILIDHYHVLQNYKILCIYNLFKNSKFFPKPQGKQQMSIELA